MFLSSVMKTGYRIFQAQHKTKMQAPYSKITKNFKMATAPLHTPTTSDLAALVGAASIWLY